ncbi:MAG: GNAT family N-acetyltransferase [Desulfobacteraceae bacterium]|jgi:GNAT superfamily N-acetyltransferase
MEFIRNAEVADAEGISSLLEQLQHPSTPEHIRRQIRRIDTDDAEAVFVAVDNTTVVGVLAIQVAVQFHQEPPVARIIDLCVLDSHRRMQFGRMLLDESEKFARKAGCCRMEVTASNFRLGAHQFYARNGLDQTHRYFRKELTLF